MEPALSIELLKTSIV